MRTRTPICDYYAFKEKKKSVENRAEGNNIIFSAMRKRQEEMKHFASGR